MPGAVWTRAGGAALGAARRACWRGAASCCRCRGGCARWRRPLALPLLVPPRDAAGRRPLRPASPPTSARARRCSCARARTCWCSTPARSTRATATPASACSLPLLRARGDAAHRPAGPQPPRQRPRRRRRARCSARCRSTTLLELARARPSAARRRRAPHTAATPASAGAGTASTSTSSIRAAADYERVACKPNALSCVLRVVSGGGRSALLTGDIEREQEAALVAADARGAAQRRAGRAAPRQPDVVDARPSSTPSRRAIAVFQAGYRNRFGHPARRCARALSRARHRASSPARRAAPGSGRPHGRRATRGRLRARRVARRYWQPSRRRCRRPP